MTSWPALPDPTHVQVDDVSIATYTLPQPTAPRGDVVLCHGTPWSAVVWADVARRLSSDFRVFLWDMPGYGASAMGPDIPSDLPAQMARLNALLRQWRLSRPHVVAHDIGGAVALGAHLLHDNDFGSLMLWDVVALEPWGSPFFRLVAEHADVFAALPPALHRALLGEYISGAAGRPLSDDELAMLCACWLGDVGQPAFYRQIAQLRVADTRPVAARLHEVRCPTAIGWGATDPWIPVEQAERLSRALPDRPAPTLLPDVGHLAPLEQPAAVHEAVLDHLVRNTSH